MVAVTFNDGDGDEGRTRIYEEEKKKTRKNNKGV
jgi:hypothetical protein